MNERKRQVITHAKRLFLEKGYRNTSIQDILEDSNISRGTFYNYFPSKVDLFKAVYDSFLEEHHARRDELLFGHDLGDMEIFIGQLKLHITSSFHNRFFLLIDDVMSSNEQDVKDFIKQTRWLYINWLRNRLADVFGDDKKPYLLDCAIILGSLLQHYMWFYVTAKGEERIDEVIRYCVRAVEVILEDVSEKDRQMLEPEVLDSFIPAGPKGSRDLRYEFLQKMNQLKRTIGHDLEEHERSGYVQMLDFIQDEMMHQRHPRPVLVKTILDSLSKERYFQRLDVFDRFKELVGIWLENVME